MYCVTVSSVGDWKILITVPRDTDTRTPISRATLPSGVRPGLPMPWQHLFLMYFLIHEAPCPPLLTSTKISHQLPSAPTVLFQGCLPREFVKQTYTYLNLPWSINWYQAPNPVFRCHANGVIWYVSFLSDHCDSTLCLWDSPTRSRLSGFHCLFLLSSVPLYEYTTVCVPTGTVDKHSSCFQFGAVYEYSLYNCMYVYIYICR